MKPHAHYDTLPRQHTVDKLDAIVKKNRAGFNGKLMDKAELRMLNDARLRAYKRSIVSRLCCCNTCDCGCGESLLSIYPAAKHLRTRVASLEAAQALCSAEQGRRKAEAEKANIQAPQPPRHARAA